LDIPFVSPFYSSVLIALLVTFYVLSSADDITPQKNNGVLFALNTIV